MTALAMPGFAAEASLFRSQNQYHFTGGTSPTTAKLGMQAADPFQVLLLGLPAGHMSRKLPEIVWFVHELVVCPGSSLYG
jgi:hypothetical protein